MHDVSLKPQARSPSPLIRYASSESFRCPCWLYLSLCSHSVPISTLGLARGSFGDRFSASIIMAAKAPMFGGGGGIVFRPEFNRLVCAYGGDAGTKSGGAPGPCGPGCSCPFCDPQKSLYDGWCDGAPHRPRDLGNMLRWWLDYGTNYNEV